MTGLLRFCAMTNQPRTVVAVGAGAVGPAPGLVVVEPPQ
jgi:hypothetical protein